MSTFDATAGSNNSKLTEIRKTLKHRGFVEDNGELVVVKNGIEVRLQGHFKLDKNNKVKEGKLFGVVVKEYGGDELYRITHMNVKVDKFLDAAYGSSDKWHKYIPKMFAEEDGILGSFFDDKLYGFNKKDKLIGYGGDDELHGGKGNDILKGYTGNDAFVFDEKLNSKHNVDTIRDWNYLKGQGGGTDSIWLDDKIFTAFKGMDGEGISSKNFVVGSKAKTADQYLVFRENKQKLYYDADGAGGDAKVLFAKFSGHHDIGYGDFLIV
ncbi:MAG: hypothetical protein KDJ86_01710 [Bauldia sp.]|uniref:hypothetical protein n=1 Tax=Bauldia sp. TaxID=2575872 RepID=UPI001D9D27E9|nr:hypothetical protein [Bauldia sp.]MCB1494475.1 hypothetical protein [Bauldia sp.]